MINEEFNNSNNNSINKQKFELSNKHLETEILKRLILINNSIEVAKKTKEKKLIKQINEND